MFSAISATLANPRSIWRLRTVTMGQLDRALARVNGELHSHGIWNERMFAVDVNLVPAGDAHGYFVYVGRGEIWVPMLSLSRLYDLYLGEYTSLADVIRHEYGHALADTHRGLFRSSRFRQAFGASIEDESDFEFDPDFHVSEYASTNASEDFCETFMLYVRHNGRLPTWHDTPAKRGKWRFIAEVCRAIRQGKRRW